MPGQLLIKTKTDVVKISTGKNTTFFSCKKASADKICTIASISAKPLTSFPNLIRKIKKENLRENCSLFDLIIHTKLKSEVITPHI